MVNQGSCSPVLASVLPVKIIYWDKNQQWSDLLAVTLFDRFSQKLNTFVPKISKK